MNTETTSERRSRRSMRRVGEPRTDHRANGHRDRASRLAAVLDLRIRPRRPDEADTIRAIARESYPIPDWLFQNPRNIRHYADRSVTSTGFGTTFVRVAETRSSPRRIVGYIYYQLRRGGECYLRDLAARPPEAAAAIPGTGTLLVAAALAHALDAGCNGLATLNIMAAHRGDRLIDRPPWRWRDPAVFYARLGFQIQPGAAGYSADRLERPAGDTWMTAGIDAAFNRAVAMLADLERPGSTTHRPPGRGL